LLSLIERQRAAGSDRLPTVRELSAQSYCSSRTLLKAVGQLRAEGVVSVSQRRGIRITSVQPSPSPHLSDSRSGPRPHRSRWQQVHEALVRDIVMHTYPPGELLPSTKELCYRYGTSFETMKKALAKLVDDGKVEPHGRGYRVFGGVHSTGSGVIVVVAWTDDEAHLQSYAPWVTSLWHALEQGCVRHGVQLVVMNGMGLLARADQAGAASASSSAGGMSVLGYLVLTFAMPEREIQRLTHILAANRRPVAVLDERSRSFSSPRNHHRARCQVFTASSSAQSGRIIGNYLLSIGHRKAAVFDHGRNEARNEQCVQGIREAFSSACLPDGVVKYAFADEVHRKHVGKVGELVRAIYTLCRKATGEQGENAIPPMRPRHLPSLNKELWRILMSKPLGELFEQALRVSDITAWVTLTDPCGLDALDYLRERGIRVPEDIAVVSTDDSLESLACGLSSYSHNFAAVVDAMFSHILSAGPASSEPIWIPGKVMVRMSTESIGRGLRV